MNLRTAKRLLLGLRRIGQFCTRSHEFHPSGNPGKGPRTRRQELQTDIPEYPGNFRIQEKAHIETPEMEFCGAHPRDLDDPEIILDPQQDEACILGDRLMRAGPFKDVGNLATCHLGGT